VRFQPDQVRSSGVAFVSAGDDLSLGAAAVRGVALPAMPPAMTAHYTQELARIADRLVALSQEQARLGEELQVRAEAATIADQGSGLASPRAGRRLAQALTGTVDVVGAAGIALRTRISVSGGRVTATSASGLRVSASTAELGVSSHTASGGAQPEHPARTGPRAEEPGSPTGESGRAAGSPTATAQGGLAAVTAADALSDHGTGSGHHGGAPAGPADAGPATHVVAPHPMPAAGDTDRQHWACWMAGQASHAHLPPTLPLIVALAHSGMTNLPAADGGAGFFGIDPGRAYAPPGHGLPRDSQPDASWWVDQPDAQLDHVLRQLRDVSGGSRDAGLSDPESLARWARDAGLGSDQGQLVQIHDAAHAMVSHCGQAGGVAAGGGHALSIARGQLGVHEVGANSGPEVNRYLAAADTAPGNPWCASFVTWSMEHGGQQLPGPGWAAVSHWVQAASAGEHGLSLVDAAHARPGDIVAYDWGGGTDFGNDGHIGFLDSKVVGGHFTAVEGNAGDAVSRMQRSVDQGNVVFIRANG